MAFSYSQRGAENLAIEGTEDDITSDNLVEKARQYIDEAQNQIDEIKRKIILLRDLCGTP